MVVFGVDVGALFGDRFEPRQIVRADGGVERSRSSLHHSVSA